MAVQPWPSQLNFMDSSTFYYMNQHLQPHIDLPPDSLLRRLPSLTGILLLQHLVLPLLPDPLLVRAINVNVEALLLVFLALPLESLPRALTTLAHPILLLQVRQVVLVRLVVANVHAIRAHWGPLVLKRDGKRCKVSYLHV